MATAKTKATDEVQIRKLIDDRIEATRSKNVEGAMASIGPDVLLFDVVNPLRYSGSDALRKRAEEWFSSFQGPLGLDVCDLSIATGDGVAFSYSLNRVSATRIDGKKLDMWWRSTVCYRKIDGRWMVTHEHNSVPFNVETGRASLDLKP